MTEYYLGIDLGGTNIKIGIFDDSFNLLARESTPTQGTSSPEVIVGQMKELAQKAAGTININLDDITAIGIGTPGPVDLTNGLVVAAPNLPNFKNTPLRDMVRDTLGKPTVMENDANAAAWAEFVKGAAQDVKELIFFTLGTGIGGGVIANGQIVHGWMDDAAELGHIIIYPDSERVCGCGQKGCAEIYASARSTELRAMEALEERSDSSSLRDVMELKGTLTCRDVFDHAKNGDALAMEIVDGTAKVLGILCINVMHCTGPERIVFAGGMIAAGDFLLDKIRENYKKYLWTMSDRPLDICFATLGEDAGIIGTAALAQYAKQNGQL